MFERSKKANYTLLMINFIMRCTRRLSAFAWILALYLHASGSTLHERRYRLLVERKRGDIQNVMLDYYRYCQNCMIAKLGAISMSLQSLSESSLEFTMVTTSTDGWRAHMYCSRDHACHGLKIYSSELPKVSTVAPGQGTLTTVFEIEESKRLPSPSASEHFKVKPTCLAHELSFSSNDCKMCLRQRSGSESFGEFHMLLDQKQYVVYVLRTSELAGTIGAACSRLEKCSFIAETEYPSDLCEHIFETGVSTYVEPGITMGGHDVVGGIPVDEKKTWVKKKGLWCLAVKRREVIPPAKSLYGHYERIMRCIECVAEILKETVHWMNVDAGPEDKAFFLYRSESPLKIKDPCKSLCSVAKPDHTTKCYQNYYAHFDMAAIEDQIFANPPEPKTNHIPDDHGKCVVAHSLPGSNSCLQCLMSQYDEAKGANLSPSISLFDFQATGILHSQTCFEKKQCAKLVFVPNGICDYEFMPEASSDVLSSVRIRENPTKGRYSHGTSSEHFSSAGTSSIDSERLATIVLVLSTELTCLVCFALAYDVVVMSATKKYLWMVEPHNRVSKCHCPLNMERKIENFKINSPRLISGDQVQKMYLDKDGKTSVVQAQDIPIVVP